MRHRTFDAALVALVLCLPRVALGQSSPENKVAAEALFDEGRKLMVDGKFTDACPKLEQSQRLDPGIGTLLYLADCYERSGRLASAWATFRDGSSQAQAAGQSERAAAGESRARALEPRLSKLTIRLSPEARAIPDLQIRQGDTLVPRGLWDVPAPVDGGEHTIVASAPGYATWSSRVRVADEKDDASVTVPALVPEAAPAPEPETKPIEPAVAPIPATAAPREPPADRSTARGSTQRALGVVLGGVGVVGVGVGSYFGLKAFSKNSDAEKYCDGAACGDPRGVRLTDDARSAAAISNVAFGLGLAALVSGVVLYATAPSSSEATALELTPLAGPRSAGLSLGGSFH